MFAGDDFRTFIIDGKKVDLDKETYNLFDNMIETIDKKLYVDGEGEVKIANNPKGIVEYTKTRDEKDSDGDGLIDFFESYKYLTDPNNPDSDNDGIPDGNWDERREYAYSIKTKMKLIEPYNLKNMVDLYQDVRVIEENKDEHYIILEFIFYPLVDTQKILRNLEPNNNWKDYRNDEYFNKYLESTITNNWDEQMSKDLIKELKENNINIDELNDIELIKQVSRFNWDRSKSHDGGFPTDFFLRYKDGKVYVPDEFKDRFNSINTFDSFEENLNNDVYGKQMYYNKIHGSCGSSSRYQTTIFRALGFPIRQISTVPIFDGTSEGQNSIAQEQLDNYKIKSILKDSIPSSGSANHTYNEVYVDGHWLRLNYDRFVANALDEDFMGYLVKLDHANDYSGLEIYKWGKYNIKVEPFDFTLVEDSKNTYQMMNIDDNFGVYCTVENKKPEILDTLVVTDAFMAQTKKGIEEFKLDKKFSDLNMENWLIMTVEVREEDRGKFDDRDKRKFLKTANPVYKLVNDNGEYQTGGYYLSTSDKGTFLMGRRFDESVAAGRYKVSAITFGKYDMIVPDNLYVEVK
ncbi:MAG: hypothetical protein FH751_07305 [Firmicutes bacterium]|nr:hypothetical protein [Bacillota bacterium]